MSSRKCPHCGLVNFATAEICKRCEKPLVSPTVVTQPEPSRSIDLIACPACNSEVSSQAAACPRCGQPINPTHPTNAPSFTNTRLKVNTVRQGGKYEAIGTGLIIIGIMMCCVGTTAIDKDQGGGTGSGIALAIGGILLMVGFVVFLAGRFM